MALELVDIHPQFLKFIFELRKQSLCTIQLTNKTEQYVAFKVKTTSPKKYCVRPNVGVIKSKGTSEFMVTMQAQSTAPPDLQCKDKFLVQCTVVPFGLTEENITSEMFVKDSSKHIEEKKMKVILVSPAESPVLLPVNGMQKQDVSYDISLQKDKSTGGAENLPPSQKDVEGFQTAMVAGELRFSKDAEPRPMDETNEWPMAKNAEPREFIKSDEEKIPNAAVDSKLRDEIEELASKLNDMGSKLTEAEQTIAQLNEERSRAMREKELLEQELAIARRKGTVKKVYVGYPFLYVCMVAMISLTFGYLTHQ